jgi:hypothetical protein
MSREIGSRKAPLELAATMSLMVVFSAACGDAGGTTGGASATTSATAKPSSSQAAKPAPSSAPSAAPSAATSAAAAAPDCPEGSTAVDRKWDMKGTPNMFSTFKGCEASGTTRIAEVKLKDTNFADGATLVVTNKSKIPFVGSIRVFAYDAAGKQLEIFSPGHSTKGDKWLDVAFAGDLAQPGKPREVKVLDKDIIPKDAKTIEGEVVVAHMHQSDDQSFDWGNPALYVNERPQGGAK